MGKGERTLLLITKGFRDALRIAYQNRPRIFDRHIVLPDLLYDRVVEVDERLAADGKTVRPLDLTQAEAGQRRAYDDGTSGGETERPRRPCEWILLP